MLRLVQRLRLGDGTAGPRPLLARLGGTLAFVALIAPLLCSSCDSDDEIVGPVDPGTTIVDFAGSDQITSPGGTLAAPLSITVADGDGPVEGVVVVWSTHDGTLIGESETNSAGIATATWRLGVGTARRFSAASAGIGGAFVNFVAFVVPGDDVVVEVGNNLFVPPSVSVAPGTTVTWVWPSTATSHNVEPVGGSVLPARSGDPVDGPFLFSQEFFFSGLYNYQCVVHGSQGTVQAGP